MVALFAILAATIAVLSQSLPSQAVQAPTLVAAPVVSGSGQTLPVAQGKLLTVTPGTWTDSPTLTYQWYRCTSQLPSSSTDPTNCQLITSSTSTTHRLSKSDVGFYMVVQETATNAMGSAYTYSAATSQVRQSNTIATSYVNLCEIRSGNLYCAGANGNTSTGAYSGMVGNGAVGTMQKTLYGPVATANGTVLNDLISVATSNYQTCVLNLTGNIYCAGQSDNAMFGDGLYGGHQFFSPVMTTGDVPVSNATSIVVGDNFLCFTTSSDTNLWCNGANTLGQLGVGSIAANAKYPTRVLTGVGTPLSGVLQAFAGAATTCATVSDGTTVGAKLYCNGANTYGQAGQGDTTVKTYSVPITANGSSTGFASASVGNNICAIQNNGVVCWGYNVQGNNGNSTVTNPSLTPATPAQTALGVSFASNTGWVQADVEPGGDHTCFLNIAGATYCTGTNGYYQLDTGAVAGTAQINTAKAAVDFTSGVTEIRASAGYTCAQYGTTKLMCIGYNINGQLATNSTTATGAVPITISTTTGTLGNSSVAPTYSASSLAGNAAVGGTITANTSWFGFPYPTLTYQWYSCTSTVSSGSSVPGGCNAIGGANSSTYQPVAGDTGTYVSAYVTATNEMGSATQIIASSNPVGVLPTSSSAPVLTTPPSSTGAAMFQTFSATPGTWTGANPVGSRAFQWYRCYSSGTATTTIPAGCSAIYGATAATYTSTKAEGGQYLRVADVYTSTAGKTYSFSDSTAQLRIVTSLTATQEGLNFCAIQLGKLYCWGYSGGADTGDPSLAQHVALSPIPVVNSDGTPMTDVVQFTGGHRWGCAIKVDRTMWCWGYNNSGQLGTNNTTTTGAFSARQVVTTPSSPAISWAQVATTGSGAGSYSTTCAIDTAGALWCAGSMSQGSIGGDGSTGTKYTFTKSSTLTSGLIQIAAPDGGQNAAEGGFCALKNTGAVVCWGNNTYATLGDGGNGSKTSYTPYLLDSGVNYIGLGGANGCALKGGQLLCWGMNGMNQLFSAGPSFKYSPIQPASPNFDLSRGIVDFSLMVDLGSGHTSKGLACALNSAGAVACNGYNNYGAFNIGDSTNRTTFTASRWSSGVTSISSGSTTTCVVLSGNAQCAGYNWTGHLGTGYYNQFNNSYLPVNVATFSGKVGLIDQAPNTISVTTSQNFAVGNTVTSNLVGEAYPIPSASYSWYSCTNAGLADTAVPGDCSPIAGANSSTYTVAAGDVGANIRVAVTLANVSGSATAVSASGLVGSAPSVASTPTGTITTSSLKLLTNQTITAPTAPVFSGTPTPTTSIKWYRCVSTQGTWVTSLPAGCYPVEGGTSATYTTTHGDDGFFLIASFTGTSSAGSLTYFTPSTNRVMYSNTVAIGPSSDYCAIKGGKVYCWGYQQSSNSGVLGNDFIRTGVGYVNATPIKPVHLADGKALSGVVSIAVANEVACAVTYSGSAYCWGTNTNSQLGDGTATSRHTAAPVLTAANTPLTGIWQIALSDSNACAINSSNAVICWGAVVPVGGGGGSFATTAISGLNSGVQQLSMGNNHACAIQNAAVRCWGQNTNGKATGDTASGVSSASAFAIPSTLLNGKYITLSQGVSSVTAGSGHTCAVRLGKVWCFGKTYTGNLAGSTTNLLNIWPGQPTDAGVPVLDSDVVQVVSGMNPAFDTAIVTCAIKVGGSVYCAGTSTNGVGVATSPTNPTAPANLPSGVTDYAVGATETCAVKSGVLNCAGSNAKYLMLNGGVAAVSTHTPITAFSSGLGISESAPVLGTASITGYTVANGVITATNSDFEGSGAWQGVPTPTMSAQWFICDSAGSATSTLPSDCTSLGTSAATYTIQSTQTGKYFRTLVTGANSLGSVSIYTAAVGPVGDAPVAGTSAAIGSPSAPVLSPASTISGTPGTVTSSMPMTTVNQWYRCSSSGTAATSLPSDCVAIPGATSNIYRPGTTDITGYVRFATVGTSAAGQAGTWSATSPMIRQGNTVAVNASMTCVVRNGRVYCWGTNTNSDSGRGDATTTTVIQAANAQPVLSAANTVLEDVVSILSATNHFCAIDIRGGVWCWGTGTNYVVGNNVNTTALYATQPSNATDGTVFTSNVVGMALAPTFTCAWKTTGAAYCWGTSASWAVGTGSTTNMIPAPLATLTSGVTKITATSDAACAIKNGSVYCWGSSSTADIGGELSSSLNTPTLRPSLPYSDYQDVSADLNSLCLVRQFGVSCLGLNTTAGIGAGSHVGRWYNVPYVQTGALSNNVLSLYSGTANSRHCAVLTSGSMYCWGQLAAADVPGIMSDPGGYLDNPTLSSVTNVTAFASYAAGTATSAGVTCVVSSGGVLCAGTNGAYQLGDGTQVSKTSSTTTVPAAVTPSNFAAYLGTDYQLPTFITQPTITAANTFVGTTASSGSPVVVGYPTPTSSSQKWVRCNNTGALTNSSPADCTDISGATAATYTLASADLGYRVRAVFSATSTSGTTTTYSAASNPVASVSATSLPRPIGGGMVLSVGETLSKTTSTWKSTLPITVASGWLRCGNASAVALTALPNNCEIIPGATGNTYTVTEAETGWYLASYESATSSAGVIYNISPTSAFVMGPLNQVAVGGANTCAIKAGNVYCAGPNTDGQLGRNNTAVPTTPFTPTAVVKSATVGDYLTKVVSISASKYSNTFCAITSSAQLWCWGADNTSAKIISSAGAAKSIATQVAVGLKVASAGIQGTGSVMCSITEGATGNKGGALYCWGYNNSSSNVGTGNANDTVLVTSKALIGDSGVTSVEVGVLNGCFVQRGALKCWGGGWGFKSLPLATDPLSPAAVPSMSSGVTKVSLGLGSGCALKDGAVYCWGDNTYGALANGTTTGSTQTPTLIGNATDGTSLQSGVTNIFSNGDNSSGTTDRYCALKNGALYCWGSGASGLAFDSVSTTPNIISTPKPSPVLNSGVSFASIGRGSSCAIKSGALYCAGASNAGVYGANLVLSTIYDTVPISIPGFPGAALADPPVSTVATVPAAAQAGIPVAVDPGLSSGTPSPSYTIAWYQCPTAMPGGSTAQAGCTAIPGATSQAYTPVVGDIGKYLLAQVTATNASSSTYYSATTGAVTKGDQSMYITSSGGSLAPGGTVQLSATATSGLSTFNWSSTTPAICSVDATGLVTGISGGHCIVSATQPGNAVYSAISANYDLLAQRSTQTISWADPGNVSFSASPVALGAAASSAQAITYASSTPSVCTVSGTNLTTVSLGTCSLTADQAGSTAFFPADQVVKSFQIVQGSQTITFTGSNIELPNGTYTLAATTDAGLAISYTTSTDASICTVSGSTLTMNANGVCAVTASQPGNANFAAASPVNANFRIVSTPSADTPASISGTPTFGVSYTSTPGVWVGAGTVTVAKQWYSCSSTGGAVAANGNFAANAPSDCVAISGATGGSFTPTAAEVGSTLRYAEQASNVIGGTTNYYTVFTAASATVVKQSQTITFGILNSATYGDAAITLTGTSDRGLTIAYSSSNTSVCSISGSTLTIVGAGNCDVTAAQAGNAGTLAAVSVVQTLTIAKANQTVSLPDFTAGVYGGAVKASGATTTASGLSVTLTSADTSICTVSGLNVSLVAPGTCSITASQSGSANYNAAAEVTKSFTISKASQAITFAPTTKQKPAGDFAAGGSASSGLAVSYSSSTTSVCTVAGSMVSPVGLGTCTITASQAGDSNYNAATSITASFTIESVPVQTTTISMASAANYRFGTEITTTAGTWTGTAAITISRTWYRCDTAPSISAGTGSAAALAPSDCVLISGVVATSYTPVSADISKFVAVAETASNNTSTGSNIRTTFVSTTTAVEKQTQTITFAALTAKTFGDAAFALTATSDRSLTITYASSDTSVCTVSGSTLTIVGAGSCDITASQAGNATTLAATDVVRTLTVNKKAQTITLPDFTAGVYGGANKASGATTTSGLTITLTSADTAVCTVSGLNVIQVTPGTCSITASQAGDANYLAATSVTKSFTIAKASQTITFVGGNKQKPSSDFAAGGSASSGLTVSYASTTAAVCTVSGSTVTPVALGTCSITASQAGDSNYLAATSVTTSFTIESVPVQTTAVVINSQTTYMFNKPLTTTAGVWAGTANITVTNSWFRCDTQPSISEGIGSVASLKPADCVAVAGSGSNYIPVADDIGKYLVIAERASNTTSAGTNTRTTFASTATVVQKQSQSLTFGALTSKAYGTAPFSLTGSSDRLLTVSYTSSNPAVCTVSGSTLTVVAPGTCDITASQAGDATTAAAADIVRTLTVTKASQTISLNNLAAIDFRGTPTALVYSATSTLPVTVTSNSTSICTVSGTTVSVVAVGTCSITASQAGDANYNAATSVTKTFVISKTQDTLTFTGATKQFRSGNFTISASTLSGASVSFTSTTTSICTVSGTTVTPVTHGACVITATAATDSNYTAPANVNATFTIERAVEQSAVHSMSSFATYWYDQQIIYTAGTWVGSGTVSVSHNWYVCTSRPTTNVVSGSTVPVNCSSVTETPTGAYKPVAADIGKYVVLAETASNVTAGGTNTSTSWISAAGVVTKWAQNLTFGALADKTYGALPFTLNGVSDQGQQISYTSSNTAVCTVSGSIVSIVAAGSCDITASQAGTTTIAAATSITQTLTINKASQTVSLGSFSNVTYSAATVTAIASATSGLSTSLVSGDISVCTISGSTITLVKAGTCSITASQAGNTNYSAATSVTKTFAIAKASQTITFVMPDFISTGEHAGHTLDATTDSDLAITYSVNNTAVCDVQNGNLVPVGVGSCVVTATQAGDDRYLSASVSNTVIIADYPFVDSLVPTGSAYTNSTSTSFTVSFNGAITGFTATDLVTIPAGACDIGEPASVNGDAAVYTVALTNCVEGAVKLKVLAGSISNGAPGPVEDSIGDAINVDFTFAQGVTIAPQFTSPTNRTSLVYNVTFSEDITGFTAADLSFAGTGSADCVASVTGSGSAYVVTLTGCVDGTVTVSAAANSVADLAGNVGPSTSTTSASTTVDLIAPDAFDVTGLPETYSRSTDFTLDFPTVAGNTYHCTLDGVELTPCDGSVVIPSSSLTNGDYTVEVWATDAAGNNSTHFSHSFSIGSYAKPAAPVINAGTFARTAFNHLTINWSLAAAQSVQLPVTGLKLEYSTNGTTWTAVPELAADVTSYDLTMQSGSTYSFRIRALSGPFAANASDVSATASYVAIYMPVITAQSTTAALLKPAAGTAITLTGTDFRDFSNTVPTATTGTVVTLTDSAGKAFVATVLSVTSTSVRFAVPAASKVGMATVKVTVGAGGYAKTSTTRNVNIVAAKVNQAVTFTAPAATRVGDADTQLTATMDSLIAPTFQIEPGSIGICTVSANGLLHPIKGGACAYKLLAVAGDAFNAFTSTSYTTTVNKLNVSIAFELPTDLTTAFNEAGKLLINPTLYQLTAVPDVAVPNTTVSVTSTPETVCFVDSELKLHVVSIGTCTITALAENDFYRTQVPVTRIFDVVKSVQTLTYIAPGTTLGNISAPQATDSIAGFQMVATLDSGMTPTFEVTDSNICTVDPSGMVSWVSDLVKSPNDVCEIKISQAGDANFYAIEPRVVRFGGTHVPPLPPVGGYVREPDGSLAVGRTGGLAASGNEGVAVVIVTGSKIAITPFSRGIYTGPITATVTIPYYIRVKNVLTYKEQLCTIKFGILKKLKPSDPNAFKVKDFKNTKACTANKDAIAWFKTGARLIPTIVVKRDRKWPTTYLAKSGSTGKGAKIWPRIKTWHLTIG
jgi:alpha-tubulin suppressor-like RCC1 family protein